ncbi:nucleolar transcription factor 1 isoform X2 [Musca domestica]|nr:nucleolar transcription factor 1 isoform X2 [Musca domestica]XP_058987075.1 nucleolar transcription factor 1 isoform X2 [Musca domestica]
MEEDPMEEFEIGEEKSIVLRVPKPVPPPPGASIEARLRAMQRKLSEIAEIPKILSSTLATVSQTFEKLNLTGMPPNPNYTAGDIYQQHLQRRKLSYDEDAFDYELSDGGNSEIDEEDEEQVEKKKKTKKKLHAAGHDDNDEFNAKEAYQRLKKHIAARRRRKSKEITPESDYASENNYSLKDERRARKGSDEEDVDDDEDDDGDGDKTISSDNTCEEFNMKCFLTPGGHDPNANGTDDEIDDEDDDDEDDFLTATFTWNLSNKSKLHNSSKDSSTHSDNPSIDSCVSSDEDGPSREKERNLIATLKQHEASVNNAHEQVEESTSKQPKLDKFWPWADREKIIYKQSTCHLVPKKPLGLIEQRIQLLAKRNLLEHLGPNNNNNVSNSSSNNIKCNK